MAQEFGAPLNPPEPPKKRNTALIIAVVVILILLCCCCVGVWAAWTYGDYVVEWFNQMSLSVPVLLAG